MYAHSASSKLIVIKPSFESKRIQSVFQGHHALMVVSALLIFTPNMCQKEVKLESFSLIFWDT